MAKDKAMQESRERLVDYLTGMQKCPPYATDADKREQAQLVVDAIRDFVRELIRARDQED